MELINIFRNNRILAKLMYALTVSFSLAPVNDLIGAVPPTATPSASAALPTTAAVAPKPAPVSIPSATPLATTVEPIAASPAATDKPVSTTISSTPLGAASASATDAGQGQSKVWCGLESDDACTLLLSTVSLSASILVTATIASVFKIRKNWRASEPMRAQRNDIKKDLARIENRLKIIEKELDDSSADQEKVNALKIEESNLRSQRLAKIEERNKLSDQIDEVMRTIIGDLQGIAERWGQTAATAGNLRGIRTAAAKAVDENSPNFPIKDALVAGGAPTEVARATQAAIDAQTAGAAATAAGGITGAALNQQPIDATIPGLAPASSFSSENAVAVLERIFAVIPDSELSKDAKSQYMEKYKTAVNQLRPEAVLQNAAERLVEKIGTQPIDLVTLASAVDALSGSTFPTTTKTILAEGLNNSKALTSAQRQTLAEATLNTYAKTITGKPENEKLYELFAQAMTARPAEFQKIAFTRLFETVIGNETTRAELINKLPRDSKEWTLVELSTKLTQVARLAKDAFVTGKSDAELVILAAGIDAITGDAIIKDLQVAAREASSAAGASTATATVRDITSLATTKKLSPAERTVLEEAIMHTYTTQIAENTANKKLFDNLQTAVKTKSAVGEQKTLVEQFKAMMEKPTDRTTLENAANGEALATAIQKEHEKLTSTSSSSEGQKPQEHTSRIIDTVGKAGRVLEEGVKPREAL